MKQFFISKKYYILLALFVVGGGVMGFSLFNDANLPDGIEIATLTKNNVEEVISETGFVVPASKVDLAFEQGGRVREILVEVGSRVNEGDVLIRLDDRNEEANLISAQAKLDAELIRLRELLSGADKSSLAVTQTSIEAAQTALLNAQRNLSEVTAQHDQLVLNAQKVLRISDIQAFLLSEKREASSRSFEAPTVSGTYSSDEEGVYELQLYSSAGPSGSSVRVTGLETASHPVSSVSPIPLGSRGLFLQFPEDFAPNTKWEIPIPNTRSSSYQTNLNAYKAALDARTVAITSAENAVASAEAALKQSQTSYTQESGSARDERIAAQRALVRQMEAAVKVAQTAYDNMQLKAPFSGVITDISAEEGEILSSFMPVLTLISSSNYELVVNVTESDIQELDIDDTAEVSFDAYEGLHFNAKVTRIAPNATIVDGVRVFEVRLQFTQAHELIKAGLSSDIDILAAIRNNVLSVPTRAIAEEGRGKFVRVLNGTQIIKVPVVVGLRGSDGYSEIISGLQEGESYISFATNEALAQLETE